MKKSIAPFALLLLMGTSAPALSAASAEDAARIAAALQAYVSAEPGVVTVTPAGDSFTASINFMPLLAKIKEPGVSASLTPFVLTLTDQGGGRWKVDQDQAVSLMFKAEGKVDIKASISSVKGTGIFDEALGGFASSSTDMTQFGLEETIIDQNTTTKVAYTIASTHYETAMTAAGDGADGTFNASFKDLRETIGIAGGGDAAMPPMEFSITAPDGTQDATVKGLKPKAIGALAAWLVAHPSEEAIKAGQAELKDKVRAALPLFNNTSGVATINGLTVNTMLGRFGVTKLDVLVDANGIVDDGRLQEKISVTGLQMPDGLVPPFAAGLVPKDFALDFRVSDFNLAAPAKLLLDNLDLNQTPPLKPEIEAQLLKALLPTGTVTFGLGPSEILAAIYHLKAESSFQAGPATSIPASQSTIQLKGLDEIMAALQAAPPEMGMAQMAPMVMMAKGMGKQEADGFLTWKIESTPQGGVLVNGADLSKMMGGGGQ